VSRERLAAWCYFDPAEFAREAFGPNPDGWRIALRDPLLLPGLRQVTDLRAVRCEITGSIPAAGLAALADLTRLESFSLRANRDGLSLRFLAGSAGLRGLDLERCAALRDVDTIAGCVHLRHLALRECGLRVGQPFFQRLAELRTLAVENEPLEPRDLLRGQSRLQRLELSAIGSHFHSLDQLGLRSALSILVLARCPGLRRLAGIEALPLRALTVVGCPNLESLGWVGAVRGLRRLHVKNIDHLYDDDYDFLGELPGLETLTLENCGAGKLAVLHGAPRLRELTIVNTSDVPDLDTLESLPTLRRCRIDLARHLGPDADRYVLALRRKGVEVTTDELEEDWSPLEREDYDDWDQLAVRLGYLPAEES
jgi:hypothetical protein